MKQAFNPYLPLNVCIPDGEPHVFGDRVYVYGSHDALGGSKFCVLDYEVFSAPVSDLTNWQSHGIVYRKEQDPSHSSQYSEMYAPDAVRGNDGRYYLYYAMAGGCFTGPIHVAVSDTPGGPFAYYGEVRNADGTALRTDITFDPAVINDGGTIRLYYGWSLAVPASRVPKDKGTPEYAQFEEQLCQVQMAMFGKTEEEIRQAGSASVMGADTVELEDDMLTAKRRPVRIVPGSLQAASTSFEGHAFFEASSIRKLGDTYYFLYSSENQHELCYATSKSPDRDFRYGGVIVSNGDIGFHGRVESDRLAATGNNHGSIECINGQWYIFYHRQTHLTNYSRQGCAEPITILPDGSIPQVEITSCGLNGNPLAGIGYYPAAICCNLTNGKMPHIGNEGAGNELPCVSDECGEVYVKNVGDDTWVGYKYFDLSRTKRITVRYRGSGEGTLTLADSLGGSAMASVQLTPAAAWSQACLAIPSGRAKQGLFLHYVGSGSVDILGFTLE